jgi:hypothetical protein
MEGQVVKNAIATNAAVTDYWMSQWVTDSVANRPLIKRDLESRRWKDAGGKSLCCMSNIYKRPGTPAIICGSGPSLDDDYASLRKFKGVIVAAMSNAPNLLAHGIIPDFICCVDAHKNVSRQLESSFLKIPREHPLSLWREKTWLVTHPMIHFSLLPKWPKECHRTYFRPMQLGDVFFEKIMGLMYPELEIAFLNAGCVTNTCLEVADFLGCNPIGFLGADMAYIDGRERCSSWTWDDKANAFVRQPDKPVQTKHLIRYTEDGLYTTEEMLAYKQNFFLIHRVDMCQLVNLSRGIITKEEIPGCTVEEFVSSSSEDLLKKFSRTREDIVKNADAVLQKHGMKVTTLEDGKLRVEVPNAPKPGEPTLIPSTQVPVQGRKINYFFQKRVPPPEVKT